MIVCVCVCVRVRACDVCAHGNATPTHALFMLILAAAGLSQRAQSRDRIETEKETRGERSRIGWRAIDGTHKDEGRRTGRGE